MPLPDFDTTIYNALSGSSGLINALGGTVIYSGIVPDNQAPPYVIFYQAANRLPNDSPREQHDNLYSVECVAETRGDCQDLAEHVYSALHMENLSYSGYEHLWSACVNVAHLVDTDGGAIRFRRVLDFDIRFSQES